MSEETHSDGARLSLRVDFDDETRLGPGKIRLLELVGETGSISAAARGMDMSYRRAWLLVDAMNQSFKEPLVSAATGGSHGGGARLTELGIDVLRRYREMETKAAASVAEDFADLAKLLVKRRA